jgi:CheY-like chemotaxis protein
MNIGLLEDNPAIIDFMSIALEMAGHKVHSHNYGSSLLETIFTGPSVQYSLPYDLLIVDILLPGNMSGLQAIHHIQQVVPPDKLPIIIISAAAREELEQIKARLPHIPLLCKPFKMNTLLQLINEMKTA